MEALRAKVLPEQTALLIIDMQKDYCCKGGIFDRRGFDVTPCRKLATRLGRFLSEARKTLGHIVHVKMTKVPGLLSPTREEHYRRLGIERKYNPTYGEFYRVLPLAGETVIAKYNYSAFVSTYLDQFLRSNGIKTLLIAGVATNVCVESTARDGFMRDYHIVVPADLTEGTSPEAKQYSLSNIDMFFGEVVNSEDVLRCWEIKKRRATSSGGKVVK
ncbi:MAG: cysteine hydrolase [Desulfomonilaceae bacterium]